MMPYILVLFYSRYGATAKMADFIARGIRSVEGIDAKIRTVPEISPVTEATENDIPDNGPIYASLEDLKGCSGLALGSPAYFGNMASPLKYFLDTTGGLWLSGDLINKPATVFTSASTMHGGQESTLLNMMTPLYHHGCILVGLPYSEPLLNSTQTGGTPYGSSHYGGENGQNDISSEEKALLMAQGKRLAWVTKQLQT